MKILLWLLCCLLPVPTSAVLGETLNGFDLQGSLACPTDQQTAVALDADGQPLPAIRAYWFAWYGFYPYTDVYEASQ
ncbi:hypothetical protein CWI75_13105 [Kineobactrum sediminis]|uniref:Uncharacterized protein n=1 Tax=Kineobactrum sediminis TaxID=1905677 RepID=A0A2N5Y0V1_9GAMM|nr:hypothetical protein [Kineobactrum sediminis]PLW82016.1 hypothetical protein CWI75_13105 [Kineobactrum sediminis]